MEAKMSQECNEKASEQAPKVHPGLAKEAWDAVLVRSGIDPATITEYNMPDAAEDETLSQK
ncbi:hypothetical protein [Rhodoferax ferrireducens]|uniref:hypothetical protein n=1 Tax=Rhodoferax ferrireducens TaxID=192843 RepID=UPI0002F08F2A|nr:hypothetical protein [Rhodoferax ferrireducens]